jgi:hypothetical protein
MKVNKESKLKSGFYNRIESNTETSIVKYLEKDLNKIHGESHQSSGNFTKQGHYILKLQCISNHLFFGIYCHYEKLRNLVKVYYLTINVNTLDGFGSHLYYCSIRG